MIMYRLRWGLIEAIEVDKVTKEFVVIHGKRSAKNGDWESFHETPEKAKEVAVARAERSVRAAEKDVERKLADLEKAKSIPTDRINPA